ncbi:MAG: c-type cytochrome [Gammaproteobacteria bacterium]
MCVSMWKITGLGLLSLGLFGCGGPDQPTDPGATGTTATVADAQDLDALLASADVERGEILYFQCRACHSMNEGGPHKVGPNLWGMFGREAGSVPGFAYSDALRDSGIVWTPATVDEWLAQPATMVPGNTMVFVGVSNAQDRANVIAFLQEQTRAPAE